MEKYIVAVCNEDTYESQNWERKTLDRARATASIASVNWGTPAYIWYDGEIIEAYEDGEPCEAERLAELIGNDLSEDEDEWCDDEDEWCDDYAYDEVGYDPYCGCGGWDC